MDQIKGALFGLAIGDALGGTTEFLAKAEIKEKYGKVDQIIGGGVWNLDKGETTDDTAMTIAVARGILESPFDPISAIGEHFIKWYKTHPKDIGNIINTVFCTYKGDWFETAKIVHFDFLHKKTAGNGSLMRCLPVALAYPGMEKVVEVTRNQSKMTHFDSLADEACVIYNKIAYHVLNGKELRVAIKKEIKGTRYEKILEGNKPLCNPDGFVVHTMEWVLYWLITKDSFLDVVVGAANEGYDSDTVGAIAGGLAGLVCGYEAIPKDFCHALLLRDELEGLSKRLSDIRNRL